ncbi:MAG: hypothetical protein IPP90_16280 [Gemmatimonadaceae bacterium]|nr:hypothetical protein [Gemmatimonadaceae bacterium]
MLRRWKTHLLLATATMIVMGAKCFSITDPLVVTLNVKDIKQTYNITAGAVNFNNPPNCVTKTASDYIDSKYEVQGARFVDATLQTVGAYTGNIVSGAVTVNGTTVVTYSGPWTSFNTPQSILTSSLLVRNPAGVSVLLNAIQNKGSITLCDGGQFSSAAPSGLSVLTAIYAQVDVTP